YEVSRLLLPQYEVSRLLLPQYEVSRLLLPFVSVSTYDMRLFFLDQTPNLNGGNPLKSDRDMLAIGADGECGEGLVSAGSGDLSHIGKAPQHQIAVVVSRRQPVFPRQESNRRDSGI